MRQVAFAALAVAAVSAAAFGAQAQMALDGQSSTVIGSYASSCYDLAKARSISPDSIGVCTAAIKRELLDDRNLAATHINRGVLYLQRKDGDSAMADFDKALTLLPATGEAYANRGAALMLMRQYPEAIADITKGLELKTAQPERAYYNRALAREQTDDIRGAYADFRQAQGLKPDWDLPAKELTRYKVTPRSTAQ